MSRRNLPVRLEVEDYVDAKLANFEIVLTKTLSAVERFFVTSATIFAATASISWSVSVFSRGWIVLWFAFSFGGFIVLRASDGKPLWAHRASGAEAKSKKSR